MSLNTTPNANRLHIAILGKTNRGKSSLINAITNQEVALVSETAGTTTDPVYKAMEVNPLGPCVFIDTAGFDDLGPLGELRIAKTKTILNKTDIALLLFGPDSFTENFQQERPWLNTLKEQNIPILAIINKSDLLKDVVKHQIESAILKEFGLNSIFVSSTQKTGIEDLKAELNQMIPFGFEMDSLTKHLIHPFDVVLLVMPQDIQAPKGRLILPQVQTIRDLLDNRCVVVSTTAQNLQQALSSLKEPPKLIITDSQIFQEVYKQKPEASLLTSFSVLFARYKGDINAFIDGAKVIDDLQPNHKVLIAEACSHNPMDGDIGRVKLPALLRKRVGKDLTIDVVSGNDFPSDLAGYQLIIHCGACMFNRKLVLSRVEAAQKQAIPITNYGVAIAKLTNVLDKISIY